MFPDGSRQKNEYTNLLSLYYPTLLLESLLLEIQCIEIFILDYKPTGNKIK